jgi:hypothetical protein
MVEAVHLRSVLTNSNLIDKIQQSQQEQQNQNLRHAVQEDLKEFSIKKNDVNLTNKVDNKIIVKDENRKQGSRDQEQTKENHDKIDQEELTETDKVEEGSIIDIRI